MRYLALLLFPFLFSCSNSADNEPGPATDTTQTLVPDTLLAWRVDAEAMKMTRESNVDSIYFTIPRIINGLNSKYPNVPLRFLRRGGDTVFTEVPDANYLGERMGSAGSTAWFADVVINLTAISGVNFVSFEMEPHSHAQSAVIGRDQYSNWIRQ